MKEIRLVAALFATIAFTNLGCHDHPPDNLNSNDKAAGHSAKSGDNDHDHGLGPHGGTIIEFAGFHGEFTVNRKTGEAIVYVLASDAETANPIQVDKLLLSIKWPQFQIELQPSPQDGDAPGKSSRFTGKHENFTRDQLFEGTLSGVIDGKPYAGDFREDEHKDEKNAKKWLPR